MGSKRARRGWLTMSARFLWRSFKRRGGTLLLALAALTVGAAVSATMLTIKADLRAKMSRELRRYGPNLIVTPRAGSTLDQAAVLGAGTPGAALLIATGQVSRAASGTTSGDAEGDAGSGGAARFADAVIVGAEFDAIRRLNPSWRLEGAWPTAHEEACLVGIALARRTGLAPGMRARVVLAGASASLAFTVSGIVSTGEAEDDQAFVPLSRLQEATGLAGRLSLAAYAMDGGPAAAEREARRLEAAIPNASARPLRPIAAAQGAILARLQRMMMLLTAVVLVLSALCLTTTMMAMVVERESEIGLMRSLGAGDGDLLRVFLGEVSLLGLAGATLGLLLGGLAARVIGTRLFGTALEMRLSVAPVVVLIALLVGWIAVIVPLRRALRIQPAAALRGE